VSDRDHALGEGPLVRAVESYDSFFRRVYRPLVGLAIALTNRRSVAEDIAQEALTAAFRSWDRVSRLDDPDAWVKRVVANRSVSLYRRSIIELRHTLRQRGEGEQGTIEALSIEAGELWLRVRQSVSRQQAIALALRYVDGLTLQEIAGVMDCSVSTASTHLRRAHQRLARELGADWKEDW
jgi:RNA polymerase sigma factor (sigma-70 family)